ncbi:MAG: hypothetical protein J7493_15265 [Porphyrobacter sp.]|nr:hypothetical protein [Porphyrobacter sp.]
MRKLALISSALMVCAIPAAAKERAAAERAEATEPSAQAEQEAGPKVHVSEAQDTTECRKVPTRRAGLGSLGGALAGRATRNKYGVIGGALAGGVAADELEKHGRCAPKANVESGAANR